MIGKDLSNPIPEWAEHGAARKVVPYTVATDMDSPNPDSGEEYLVANRTLPHERGARADRSLRGFAPGLAAPILVDSAVPHQHRGY